MNKIALLAFLISGTALAQAASASEKGVLKELKGTSLSGENTVLPDTGLIDVPTAGVLDYYGLQTKSRFFSRGSVLEELSFGVLARLNVGASAALEEFLGTGSPVRLVRPGIQFKYRFYDGGKYLPALAVGYDGQGYYYDRDAHKFLEAERGVYLAASRELFVPNFQVHPGINVSDFDSDDIFGFVGLDYTIEDSAALMLEWDHIQRFDESRLNAGVRFYVTPFFHIDLACRDIGENSRFKNGLPHKPERVVQLKYIASF